MVSFFLSSIAIVAALSLLSYLYCWSDIKSGRPHIIALRQITMVMDRARLNQWFGNPEPGYYYQLTPAQVASIIRSRRWFYVSECAADSVCLIGAWRVMIGAASEGTVVPFIILATLCQSINLLYSLWLIRKWRDQIQEELENSGD
jgi:hypothetical protein